MPTSPSTRRRRFRQALLGLAVLTLAPGASSQEPSESAYPAPPGWEPLGWTEEVEATGPVRSVSLEAPRSYGLRAGDRIRHRIRVEVAAGAELQVATLPAERDIHRWLELQSVSVQRRRGEDIDRYTLRLRYQVFATPNQVEAHRLPGFTVAWGSGEESGRVVVPDWRFTLTPLLGKAVERRKGSFEVLQPDIPPEPLPISEQALRVAGWSAASLALGAFLLATGPLRGRFRRSRPLARAHRQLRRLRRGPADWERVRAGYRVLHRALDETAGEAVFEGRLDRLRDRVPALEPASDELAAFFAESRNLFFGSGLDADTPTTALARIEARAEELARRERRG